MNDKKNIDRFFQKRFKDFEEIPPPQAWENIQLALKKKEKSRKVIPFWLQTTGIAAALFLGLALLNTIAHNKSILQNNATTKTKMVHNSIDNKRPSLGADQNKNDATVVKNTPSIIVNAIKTEKKNEKISAPNSHIKIKSDQEKVQNTAVVYFKKNNPSVKQASKNFQNQVNSQLVDQSSLKNKLKPEHNLLYEPFGKSDAASQSNNSVATIDLKNKEVQPNELEKMLKEQTNPKQEAVVVNQKNKWKIVPNVAAMYLNVTTNGSAIDPQFSENQKTSENSLSYGVGVHYAFSKKLALRSGINRLSVGYNTNNVVYSIGLVNNNLSNIRYSSKASIEIKNNASQNSLSTFEKDLQKTNTGAINQKMGYYEVPLEVSYVFLDKKISIDLIGGFSTLFLNQNKIALISPEAKINLGEANNLNPIHFSTNVGLGFRYKIVKAVQINVEPMLKYQINTFSSQSGGFKPVFIGLYSGISYSF